MPFLRDQPIPERSCPRISTVPRCSSPLPSQALHGCDSSSIPVPLHTGQGADARGGDFLFSDISHPPACRKTVLIVWKTAYRVNALFLCRTRSLVWLTLGSLDHFICSGKAGVLFSAAFADWLAALRAGKSVLNAPGRITAIGTRERDGSAFDSVLACRVVLRDDRRFAA